MAVNEGCSKVWYATKYSKNSASENSMSVCASTVCFSSRQLYRIEEDTESIERLTEAVRRGIESARATAGKKATADVDIDLTVGPEIEEIHQLYTENGPEAVTENELHLLYQSDYITTSEYIEAIEEKIEKNNA